MSEDLTPCRHGHGDLDVFDDYVDTHDNCCFLIQEQDGGDETNRQNFCLIHGYDYPEKGCRCRKTMEQLIRYCLR